MSELNIALALVGATVLIIGMVSRLLNRSILSLPLLAFLLGVLAGPVGWLVRANWRGSSFLRHAGGCLAGGAWHDCRTGSEVLRLSLWEALKN